MHMGLSPSFTPPVTRTPPSRLTVCHLLTGPPCGPAMPCDDEIAALQLLGHAVVPVSLAAPAPTRPADHRLSQPAALSLDAVETLAALKAAAANPSGLAAAVGFAQRQRGLPRRALLRAAARLAYVVRAQRCTHIHSDTTHEAAAVAICGARIAGVTASFSGHGRDLHDQDSDLALLLAAADLVVTTSDATEAAFRRLAPHARLQTIGAGVAPERFRPRPGPSNGRLLVAAPNPPGLGLDDMLAALEHMHRRLRPMVDIVADSGADSGADSRLAAALTATVQRLGLEDSVTVLGGRGADWLAAHGPFYQGFVLPGTIAPDGPGEIDDVVLKQAMAMGLPAVATALPGVRAVLDGSCGRVVESDDRAGLAAAMVWLADLRPAERLAIGLSGRTRVQQRFTLCAQAARLAAAFSSLHA